MPWSNSGGAGATIDQTAADIQPIGTRAAGGSGLAADARHVHPTANGQITLGVDTALAAGVENAALLTSPDFPPGEYRLTANLTVTSGGTAGALEATFKAGTATVTAGGPTSAGQRTVANAGAETALSFEAFVTVTAHGTVTLAVTCATAATAKATTQQQGYPGATALIWEQIG